MFRANKKAVLEGTCLSKDNVCFGIGQATPRSDSTVQQEVASSKAELAAKVNLICRKSAAGIVWPKDISPENKAILAALTARALTLSAKVKGVEVVYREKGTNRVQTVVVAVQEEALSSVPRATFDDAKRILLEPHSLRRNFRKYPDALYALYISQKPLPATLRGTSYREWTPAQLNTFCGLPNAPEPAPASVPATDAVQEEEELETLPRFILPPCATANENETIGF